MLTLDRTSEPAALSALHHPFWVCECEVLHFRVALWDIEGPPTAIFLVIEDGAHVHWHPRVTAAAK